MSARAADPGRAEAGRRRREVERRLAAAGLGPGPRRLSSPSVPQDREAVAARLAAVLPDLGPVPAAFGRYLALRADVFTAGERRWFQHLEESAPVMPAAAVRAAVAEALGADVDDLFAGFSELPVRVGLTVQVHAATTAGGAAVEVHVARPDAAAELRRELPLVPRVLAAWPEPLPVGDLVAGFREWAAAAADLPAQAAGLVELAEEPAIPGLPAVAPVEPHLTAGGVMTVGAPGGAGLPRRPPRAPAPEELARRVARAWLAPAIAGPRPWTAADLRRLDDGRLVVAAARFAAAPGPPVELGRYLTAMAAGDVDHATVELLALADAVAAAEPPSELRRTLRQLPPAVDERRDGPVDALAETLLDHWRLLRRAGYRPRPPLAAFYQGLAWLEGELRAVAPPAAAPAVEPLREAFEDVQWALSWRDFQRLMEPRRLAEAIGQTLDGLVLAPARLERWMNQPWSEVVEEPPGRPMGGASDSTIAVVAVAAAMLAVALATPHLAAVAGPWAERLGAVVFLALGALYLGVAGGRGHGEPDRNRRPRRKEER